VYATPEAGVDFQHKHLPDGFINAHVDLGNAVPENEYRIDRNPACSAVV
jgi:hypothetical protein